MKQAFSTWVLRLATWAAGAMLATGCDLGLSQDKTDTCKPLGPTTPAIMANTQINVAVDREFCDTLLPMQYALFQFTDVPGLIADIDGYAGEWTFPPGVLASPLDSGASQVRWGRVGGNVCARRWNTCTTKGELTCIPVKTPDHNVWTPLPVESQVFDRGPATAMVGDAIYVLRPLNRAEVWKGDPKTGIFELVTKDFLPMPQLELEKYSAGVAVGHGTDLWFLSADRKFRFNTLTKTWENKGLSGEVVPRYSVGFAFGGKLYISRDAKGMPTVAEANQMLVFDPADGSLNKFEGIAGSPRAVTFARKGKPVFGPWPICPTGQPPCYDNGFRTLDTATLQWTPEPYHLPNGVKATVAFDFEGFDIVGAEEGRLFRIDEATDAVTEIAPRTDLGCAGKQIHRTSRLAGSITAGGVGWVFGGENDVYALYGYVP